MYSAPWYWNRNGKERWKGSLIATPCSTTSFVSLISRAVMWARFVLYTKSSTKQNVLPSCEYRNGSAQNRPLGSLTSVLRHHTDLSHLPDSSEIPHLFLSISILAIIFTDILVRSFNP